MWWNKYIGLPYQDKGRDANGIDCWGLVRLVYKEEFNVELPSFTDEYVSETRDSIQELISIQKESWEKTDTPEAGDVIVFRILGLDSHVGIYIGNNKFLHALENHSSVIESLDSVHWKNRVSGIFKYCKNTLMAPISAAPHPLRTERIKAAIPYGSTVRQVRELIDATYYLDPKLQRNITIMVNGKPIPESEWDTTVIRLDDVVEYRAVAGKSALRLVLTIALAYYAPILAGSLTGYTTAATYASYLGTSVSVGLTALNAAATVGIMMAGTQLINAIAPVRMPSMPDDPGSSERQLMMQGGQNTATRYGAIPVVLGRVRMTAPLAANTFVENGEEYSYLNMMLAWGFGPLSVTDLFIGTVSIDQFDNGNGLPVEYATIYDTFEDGADTDVSKFNKLYSNDVEQKYLGIKLVKEGDPTNYSWTEVGLTQTNLTKITAALHFPQGLRRLWTKGDRAGQIDAKEARIQVQTRKVRIDPVLGRTPLTDWADSTFIEVKRASVSETFDRVIEAFGGVMPGEMTFKVPDAYATRTVRDLGGSQRETTTIKEAYYQWTRFAITPSGNIVSKTGALMDESWYRTGTKVVYDTFLNGTRYSTGKTVTLTAAQVAAQQEADKPTWSAEYFPIADVLMYGDTIQLVVSNTTVSDAYHTYQPILKTGYTYTGLSVRVLRYTSYDRPVNDKGSVGVPRETHMSAIIGVAEGTITAGAGLEFVRLGIDKYVKKKDAFTHTVTISVETSPDITYDVRVSRMNSSETEPQDDIKDLHDCVLQDVTGYTNNPAVIDPPNCDIVRTALRIRATEQINGQIDGINALVHTICKDWDYVQNKWIIRKTNNPASLFLYILQHPANAQRITEPNLAARVDLAALQDWHNFCRENAFQFNSVVASTRSLMEVLRDVAAAGRASPALVDGKWTVLIDRPRTTVVQHFTPHNSWGFESTKRLPKQPEGLRITFPNELKGFQEEEIIIYNSGVDTAAATLFEQISLPGITHPLLVQDHARWHMAQAKLRPELYTISTDFEYLVCNRGDLVKVQHDVPMWGTASGRIKNIVNTTTLELDEEIPMKAGVTHTMRVRTQTGASEEFNLTPVGVDGYYTTVTSTTTLPTTLAAGDLYMAGELGKESVDLIVLSIEPFGTSNAKLTLVDYSPQIYDINYRYNFYIPDFETQITQPPKLLVGSIVDKPTISEIISDERVLTQIAPGVFAVNMQVSFTQNLNLPKEVTHLEVQAQLASDTAENWAHTETVDVAKNTATFRDLIELETYKLRVRYVSNVGRTGPWSDVVTHQVVGKTSNPSAVTGLAAAADVPALKVALTWTPNPELDVAGYEVRTSDTDWGDGNYVFHGNATKALVDPAQAEVARTWYVRAYDTGNRYSDTSATASFTVPRVTCPQLNPPEFADTSLTDATVTLSWNAPQILYGVSHYEVYRGTVQEITTAANKVTLPAGWIDDETFRIHTVDKLNNKCLGVPVVVNKLRPTAPGGFEPYISGGSLFVTWVKPAKTSLPIWGYEVATDSLFSNVIYRGTDEQVQVPASVIAPQQQTTLYFRTVDTDNYTSEYSTYLYTKPAVPNVTNVKHGFYDTSLTSATITLTWTDAEPAFGLSSYTVSYGTTQVTTKSNQIVLPADWVGLREFVITTVDTLNNTSSGTTETVEKKVPDHPLNITAQVVDNNVLLYWDLPEPTTLPVSHVNLRVGPTLATSVNIGDKDGTFTSFSELVAGDYTYWLCAVDTDGRGSTYVPYSAKVSQPPDFIFNALFDSTFTGTLNNAYKDENRIVLPVNTTETFAEHFTAEGWAGPQDQVSAGYPVYIQPGLTSGYYEETFDYGNVLGSSQISLTYALVAVSGNPSVSASISTSEDGITYTVPSSTASIFATNFRYVKVRITCTQNVRGDLAELLSLSVRLDSKQKSDAGNVSCSATDVNGTPANTGKDFVDIISIVLAAQGTQSLTPVYSFKDYVISGTYTVTSNVATITANNHQLYVGQQVKLVFTSGTAPDGKYAITEVVDANTYKVAITTPNTSGNVTHYANSFMLFVYDTNGQRQSATVSWSVRGY